MSFKGKLFKKVIICSLVTTILGSNGMCVSAKALFDEKGASYGWVETVGNDAVKARVATYSSEPVWTLKDNKDVAVANGTINLKSYTMTHLNDTKSCKGVTVHSGKFYGYVRARFETIFGGVHSGSDSGRKFSYYGTTAETPDSDVGGWNGIAHTYCGTQ